MSLRKAEWCVFAFMAFFVAGCGDSPRTPPAIDLIRQAHDRMLTVDARIGTVSKLMAPGWDIGPRHRAGKRGAGQVDLPRMKEGGLDAAFFAIPVPQGPQTPEGYAPARESVLTAIDRIRRMAEEQASRIGLALSPEDAYRLEKEGKLAAFMGLGNAYALGTDLSLIEAFHGLGVRYLTLCGDSDNQVCDVATDHRDAPEDGGLSEFGRRVVAECNRVGMMIDLAGASERSFYDVLRSTRAPVIVSHAAARALRDHPRNLSDEMLRALAKNGGVVHISFSPDLLAGPGAAGRASVADIAEHILHATEIAGFDHVGIGSEFDSGGGVAGCEDVAGLLNVTMELMRRGVGEIELEAAWAGNTMSVLKRILASAAGKRGRGA
jgi:membrane dipeptidase